MSSRKGVDQLIKGVANINLESSEDGPWESVVQKQNDKDETGAWRPWGLQNPAPKASGQRDAVQRLGMQSNNTPMDTWNAPNTDMGSGGMRSPKPTAVQHGRNRQATTGSQALQENVAVDDDDDKAEKGGDDDDDRAEQDDDDDDVLSDDYDDELLSDDYDSDEGPRTHESRKQRRMLKDFFEILDKLNVQEINDPVRQWHCPACQGGPCAIKWYKGLRSFMTHARTKRSIRVKLHREFAVLLVEELRRRGTPFSPSSNESGIEDKVV